MKIEMITNLEEVHKILKEATKIKYFTKKNNYTGEYGELPAESDIRWVVEDVELGHAQMWKIGETYQLDYTVDCKWEI